MKKILIPITAAFLLAALSFGQTKMASAGNKFAGPGIDPDDETPDFADDFESYTNYDDMASNWTNGYFEHTGDGNEECCKPVDKSSVTEQNFNRFEIVADPDVSGSHGKCLRVDTASAYDSFTYLTMRDLMVKDFVLTYDFYHDLADQQYDTNWFGIMSRKPVDGRYNGVSNVLVTHTFSGGTNSDMVPYRCVETSFGAIPDGKRTKGDIFSVEGWVTMKLECKSVEVEGKTVTNYSFYGNDTFIGGCQISQASSQIYGLVSFAACVSVGYIDNVYLENLDEVPYTPAPIEDYTPTVPTETLNYTRGQDLEVTVDLKGQAFTSLKQGTTLLLPNEDFVLAETLTLKDSFLSTLSKGNKSFLLTTAGGSAMFTVKIPEKVDPTPTPEPTPTPSKSGCGSSIVAASALISLVAVAGVALVAGKKKQK